MEDDFVIYENGEGIDEETAEATVAGKKIELDTTEAFGIFDLCKEMPKDVKVITNEMGERSER